LTRMRFELAHITRDEVAQYAPDSILVLPTAATEQHGPHLPLGTDAMLGEAVAREALRVAETASPLVLAPVMPFGSSHHHLIFSALSLSTDVYLASINDLLDTALQSGFRRIYVMNSHGGNVDCVRLAARDTALNNRSVIGTCSYWDVSMPELESNGYADDWPVPGHAGQFETSMMLAIRPELVRLDQLPADAHTAPRGAEVTQPGSVIHVHGDWARMDGFTDAPVEPTAELGREFLRIAGASVAKALEEFDTLSLRSMMEAS